MPTNSAWTRMPELARFKVAIMTTPKTQEKGTMRDKQMVNASREMVTTAKDPMDILKLKILEF